MTDYFYQARRRDQPPEGQDGDAYADAAGRRNPYPPEDEAYWSEQSAAPAPAGDEPLWYEDRVRREDAADPGPFPPEPEPGYQPAPYQEDWRGQAEDGSEAEGAGYGVAEDGTGPTWAGQPYPEAATEPVPAAPPRRRSWGLFRKRAAGAELPAEAPAPPEEPEAHWPEPSGGDTTAAPPPPEPPPGRRRGWLPFRSKRAEPEVPAVAVVPAVAAVDETAAYWAEQAAPEEPAAYWQDDGDPGRHLAYDREPAAYAPDLDDYRPDHDGDAGEPLPAAWADEPSAADERMRGARDYVPGAAAAAARAAREAGERNIRFDPTKERGQEYHDRAARHSRHVRLLKVGLPTVAVLSVIGFFAVMSFDADDEGLPALNLSGVDFDQREIIMDKPHISGFEGTKRSYEIHAKKAVQAFGDTKVITFETITAKFAMGDDGRANLEAATGTYDSNTQKLRLGGGITLVTTSGYTAELEDADVDVEAGNVDSDTGVSIRGKEGVITSDSIEVRDRGKHVFFRGNVKVVYQPPETPDKPEKQEQAGGTAEAPAPAPAATPAVIEAAPNGST